MERENDADGKPTRRNVLKSVTSDPPARAPGGSERRGFLKNALGLVGGSVATFLGSSTRAAAMSPRDEGIARTAAAKYRSPSAVRGAVRSHAAGLLRHLAREGHLERGTVAALPLGTLHESIRSYADAEEGVLVHATAADGRPYVKIQVKRRLPDGRELVLVVDPRDETAQAFFEGTDPTRQTADSTVSRRTETHYTASSTESGDVTIQGCERDCGTPTYRCGYACSPYDNCGCANIKIRDSCTDPDCFGCFIEDYSCCGDYKCD